MMVSHIGDSVVGMCVCAHPPYPDVGIIVGGSPMFFDMGPGISRLNDPVIFSCGSSVIVSSSALSFNIGPGISRNGDSVTGCGVGVITSVSNDFML